MSTKAYKLCAICGPGAIWDLIGSGAEGGRVWRCRCCFKSVPARKYTKTEPQWKIDAKARLATELAAREALALALTNRD